jgi:hypothetical protein
MDAEKMMMQKRIDNLSEMLEKYQDAIVPSLRGWIEKLERERDAVIADLAKARNCNLCKHDAVYTSVCDECKYGSSFEWRGLCYENGGAEDGQDHSD